MKKERLFFSLAGAAFLGMSICVVTYFFLPEPEAYGLLREGYVTAGKGLTEDEIAKSQALEEIRRLKESYGIEVSPEEMEKQIAIQKEYEAAYGSTYPIEEVFLPNPENEAEEGDPGEDDAYLGIIEEIGSYMSAYEIEESRYLGMTAEEELEALKRDYGPLKKQEGGRIPENEG